MTTKKVYDRFVKWYIDSFNGILIKNFLNICCSLKFDQKKKFKRFEWIFKNTHSFVHRSPPLHRETRFLVQLFASHVSKNFLHEFLYGCRRMILRRAQVPILFLTFYQSTLIFAYELPSGIRDGCRWSTCLRRSCLLRRFEKYRGKKSDSWEDRVIVSRYWHSNSVVKIFFLFKDYFCIWKCLYLNIEYLIYLSH